MAGIGDSEKVLPCLLDRLTDFSPGDQRPGSSREALSAMQYRDAVLRDIQWLMGTTARSHTVEPEIYASRTVRSSVINYGIPDIAGRWASGVDARDLEQEIRDAFLAFEPRVNPDTLTVKVLKKDDKLDDRAMRIEIKGELWAQPVPEPLLLTAVVDQITGQCDVQG